MYALHWDKAKVQNSFKTHGFKRWLHKRPASIRTLPCFSYLFLLICLLQVGWMSVLMIYCTHTHTLFPYRYIHPLMSLLKQRLLPNRDSKVKNIQAYISLQ